jgi:hypothetical protein
MKYFTGYLAGLRMQIKRLDYTPTFQRKPKGWLAVIGPFRTKTEAKGAILYHNRCSNATYVEVN